MVKHSSSMLKFHSLRDITNTGLQLPQLSCIMGAVLLARPKYLLSQGKPLCTLYFVSNEASSSLVLHPYYIHNSVSHSIS